MHTPDSRGIILVETKVVLIDQQVEMTISDHLHIAVTALKHSAAKTPPLGLFTSSFSEQTKQVLSKLKR